MTSQSHAHPSSIESDAPAFTSSSYLGLGLFLAFLGGVVFAAVTANGGASSGGVAVLALAVILVVAGHILFAIGVIAKGVKLGNRESRSDQSADR